VSGVSATAAAGDYCNGCAYRDRDATSTEPAGCANFDGKNANA